MTNQPQFFAEQLILLLIDKVAIGVLLLLLGFVVSRLLEKFKSDLELHRNIETTKYQAALGHLQKQIEELYSPLLGLVQYLSIVRQIANKRLELGDDGGETKRYFVENYYLPINKQISDLMQTKIYLLETDGIPDSFKQFIRHQAQYESLHSLWKHRGVQSEGISAEPHPPQLEQDLTESLERLRTAYTEIARKLTHV